MEPEASLFRSQDLATGPYHSQMNPVRTLTHCFFLNHFNIISLLRVDLSNGPFPSGIQTKILQTFIISSHVCYMPPLLHIYIDRWTSTLSTPSCLAGPLVTTPWRRQSMEYTYISPARKCLWHDPGICPEVLRKTTKNLSWDSGCPRPRFEPSVF